MTRDPRSSSAIRLSENEISFAYAPGGTTSIEFSAKLGKP
jgi:hypothetical protein